MKLSNQRILNDAARLGEISQKQLPVKVSYAVAKNISKIESELKIYNKERQKLIDQYAEKDDKGKIIADERSNIKFKEDCKEKWDKDIKDLMAIESEIDIHKFKMSEFEGKTCDAFSPSELMAIDYMIEE